MIEQMKTDELK